MQVMTRSTTTITRPSAHPCAAFDPISNLRVVVQCSRMHRPRRQSAGWSALLRRARSAPATVATPRGCCASIAHRNVVDGRRVALNASTRRCRPRCASSSRRPRRSTHSPRCARAGHAPEPTETTPSQVALLAGLEHRAAFAALRRACRGECGAGARTSPRGPAGPRKRELQLAALSRLAIRERATTVPRWTTTGERSRRLRSRAGFGRAPGQPQRGARRFGRSGAPARAEGSSTPRRRPCTTVPQCMLSAVDPASGPPSRP